MKNTRFPSDHCVIIAYCDNRWRRNIKYHLTWSGNTSAGFLQWGDTCNHDQIGPFKNYIPSTTSPRNRLQQPLSNDDEYVVERLVAHRKKPSRRKYHVQRYGYNPEGSTFEPSKRIPGYFKKYWKSRQARSNCWVRYLGQPRWRNPAKREGGNRNNIWQQANNSIYSTVFKFGLWRLSPVSIGCEISFTRAKFILILLSIQRSRFCTNLLEAYSASNENKTCPHGGHSWTNYYKSGPYEETVRHGDERLWQRLETSSKH